MEVPLPATLLNSLKAWLQSQQVAGFLMPSRNSTGRKCSECMTIGNGMEDIDTP